MNKGIHALGKSGKTSSAGLPASSPWQASGYPLHHVPLGQNHTVTSFITAVTEQKPEDAMHYVSKGIKAVGAIDLDELKEIFGPGRAYKYLNKVRFGPLPQNIAASSLLVMDPKVNGISIIHIYMIKEPDLHGTWKICGIERE